jgi:hypothetical protein
MRALPALVLVCAARPLLADVGPDDVVTAANADAVEGLVPPGVEWMVHRGMRITVGKTRAIALPDAYVNATRRYSADVRLRPDGRGLENWTAGQPFPVLDPADPDIARKIMHNFDSRWWESDDVDLRNLDADSGGIGSGSRGMAVEKHFVIDHFKRLYFTGRLTLEPKPAYVPNNDAVRYKESLHPLIEPFDLKGVGFTYYRYLDAARQDDSWLYLPQIRRVRRLSSAQRSDALFGQDTDQDSYGGYAGNIAWMDWRFVGEATVLAPVHGVHFPAQWGPGSSDFTFDDIWEKRRVYVVEGVSKLAQYAYGKRVLFVDKEAFFIPYSDIYDRAGQLWKVWLNNYRFAREPWPDAPDEGRYPSDMPFLPSIVMVDVQRDHVTRASLPSRRFVREVGWRFNKGEQAGTREEFFSVAELLRAGH